MTGLMGGNNLTTSIRPFAVIKQQDGWMVFLSLIKERKGKRTLAPSVGVSTTLVSQSSHDEISSIIHSFSAMQ